MVFSLAATAYERATSSFNTLKLCFHVAVVRIKVVVGVKVVVMSVVVVVVVVVVVGVVVVVVVGGVV